MSVGEILDGSAVLAYQWPEWLNEDTAPVDEARALITSPEYLEAFPPVGEAGEAGAEEATETTTDEERQFPNDDAHLEMLKAVLAGLRLLDNPAAKLKDRSGTWQLPEELDGSLTTPRPAAVGEASRSTIPVYQLPGRELQPKTRL